MKITFINTYAKDAISIPLTIGYIPSEKNLIIHFIFWGIHIKIKK